MAIDPWIPMGFSLPDGACVKLAMYEGADWQIYDKQGGGRVLVVRATLSDRWIQSGLVASNGLMDIHFGTESLRAITGEPGLMLEPVFDSGGPNNKSDAMRFVQALRSTRELDSQTSLHDALYVETLSRLLPTYTLAPAVPDDVLLGQWLSGGVPVSAGSIRRLHSLVGWMGRSSLEEVVKAAGLESMQEQASTVTAPARVPGAEAAKEPFTLVGRPQLEQFFNEHIIDLIEHSERYRALGIDFPSAVILHGPPGCGKTFAVERLAEYLGWPSFSIDASSVASPYIHETSKKVAAVFENAIKNAPSVIIIDEMEAFLTDRQRGAESGLHRVEEVAEFLRRIPEAIKNQVLIIAMTNHLDMIDPAILRRGRFDHVIEVGMASEIEIKALLDKLLGGLPQEPGVDTAALAQKLRGRPLSDVSFMVREGARLAARSGGSKITQDSLLQALAATPARNEEKASRKIGFV